VVVAVVEVVWLHYALRSWQQLRERGRLLLVAGVLVVRLLLETVTATVVLLRRLSWFE
jgi:hypothetical protein